MGKKVSKVGAVFLNTDSSPGGVSYIYADKKDGNKFKIGRGTKLGEAVSLSIDRSGVISGSSFTGGSFSGGSHTGSFTGSFTGDGDGLTNLNVNIDGTAAVNIGEFFFDKSSVSLSAKPAIKIEAQNMDAVVCRVDNDGLDLGSHGFSIKYMGSRAGNDNSLSFFSDNETAATQIEALTIVQDGTIGIGTTTPKVPLDINEMGGLTIAETYLVGAGTGTFLDVTTSMTALLADFKSVFVCPANGKIKIRICMFVVHSGAEGEDHSVLDVGIHDGTGFVYDITGNQLLSQETWGSVGDNHMQVLEFIIDKDGSNVSLVPGTTYTFTVWLGSNENTEIKVFYGTNYPPIILEAISVPNTIAVI